MKKIIGSICLTLLVLLMPQNVLASKCKLVTGTGTNIGDEIECGGEHFYVLSNNGTNIKMLSKYNLYIGYMIEEDGEYLVEDYENDYMNAYDEALSHEEEIKEKYPDKQILLTNKLFVDEEGNIQELGLFYRIFTPLEYSEVKQDSKSVGLQVVDGMVKYPLYGDVAIDGNPDYNTLEEIQNPFDEYGNLIIDETNIGLYLDQYQQTLKNKGIEIEDINLIHRSGLEELLKNISGENIILGPTYDDQGYINFTMEDMQLLPGTNVVVLKKNIKPYIPEKFNWILQTSYWIGSGSPNNTNEPSEYIDEFLTSYGDYCSNARGCNSESNIGIGLRPVVTINKNAIESYSYEVKIGQNQTLNINEIKNYSITVDGDYSLFESLTIGNTLLIKDEDYTITEGSTIITFTDNGLNKLKNMKTGNYQVLVKYTNSKQATTTVTLLESNPETGDNILSYIAIGIISLMALITTITIFIKKKTK